MYIGINFLEKQLNSNETLLMMVVQCNVYLQLIIEFKLIVLKKTLGDEKMQEQNSHVMSNVILLSRWNDRPRFVYFLCYYSNGVLLSLILYI